MVPAKPKHKEHVARNSLIAWWLGLGAFTALPWVQSLLQELRSFKPSSAAKKKIKECGGSGVQDGEHMYTHVADHALITKLIILCSRECACTDHVADHALIT